MNHMLSTGKLTTEDIEAAMTQMKTDQELQADLPYALTNDQMRRLFEVAAITASTPSEVLGAFESILSVQIKADFSVLLTGVDRLRDAIFPLSTPHVVSSGLVRWMRQLEYHQGKAPTRKMRKVWYRKRAKR
jgi:hypothetical protein